MKLCLRIVENQPGQYKALCPSLPGCMSSGSTREEARRKLEEAIRGYIAAVNNFVPERLLNQLVEV